MRLVSVYKLADEQLYGSSLMHCFRPCVCCLCIRGLMHNRLAVDEWLKAMRHILPDKMYREKKQLQTDNMTRILKPL